MANFDKTTVAHAFFFKTATGLKSLRLISRNLGWEHSDSDSIYPGNLTGIIHYNKGYFDGENPILDPAGNTDSKFYVEQYWEENKRKVRIKFYDPKSPDVQFAMFTAMDPLNRAGERGTLNTFLTARWRKVAYDAYSANVQKNGGTATAVVTSNGREATVQLPDIQGDAFNVSGTLVIKDSSDAQYVLWCKYGCVFYNEDPTIAKDFTAVFISKRPMDPFSSNIQPSIAVYPQHTIGSKDDLIANKVTWRNLPPVQKKRYNYDDLF